MKNLNEIEKLIYLFSKLPGLGQRSSRRIVLHLLQDKEIRLKMLLNGLEEAINNIYKCQICNNIDATIICRICSSDDRDTTIIAIVETVAELWALERSNNFKGHYHVLGSPLSTHSCHNASELKLPELLRRCQENNVQEIIIATNATVEGQTTAYFITEYFKNTIIKISRLASGIPIGGELDYLDEGTLTAALNLRQIFK